jgi:hypothetical protein
MVIPGKMKVILLALTFYGLCLDKTTIFAALNNGWWF